MPNLTTLIDKMSGKVFREALNTNFSALNSAISTHDTTIKSVKTSVDKMNGSNGTLQTDVDALKESHNNLKAGLNNVFITSLTSSNGTSKLPGSGDDTPVTVVGKEAFEHTTEQMNTAIQDIIKGKYIKAGDSVEIVKTDSGITISSKGGTTVNHSWQHSNPNLLINADWRHPASFSGVYDFIKKDDSVETKAHPAIACWEVNYSNAKGVGYSFYDVEENWYSGFQGTSPTDTGDMATYATLSQSFPEDWGDELIGKKLTFSIACADSYAEYQNHEMYVYSYTFTAKQGYTGWLTFPYPSQMQFGIHFNTELNGHMENEITIRFNNLWVYALKLEIGETETLSADLLQPCDCYEQARKCEEYVQSIFMDGLIHVDELEGFTGETATPIPFAEIQNYMAYMKGNRVYINVPLKKPMMSKPNIEIYDANGIMMVDGFSPCIVYANDTAVKNVTKLQISNWLPGASYIQLFTDITLDDVTTTVDGDLSRLHTLIATFNYNVVFTCEERWG